MKSAIRDFIPVIMAAGNGSRMSDLMTNKPKCLLPVGNKPMLWYSLQMLENFGFSDVIVIVQGIQLVDIQLALEKIPLKIRIDYVCIASDKDLGTADSLRQIADKCVKDLMIMSCDFITNASLQRAIDLFHENNASLVALLFDQLEPNGLVVPGPKNKQKPERDLIGVDRADGRLVFFKSASDFDEEVTLKRIMLKFHATINMSSDLMDAHFYLIRNWVVQFLKQETSFNTLKGELLPHIIKKQHSRIEREATQSDESLADERVKTMYDFARDCAQSDAIVELSHARTQRYARELQAGYYGDVVKCFGLFIAQNEYFGLRVNTLATYCLANSVILDKWESVTNGRELIRLHPSATIKTNQIDDTSMVDYASQINECTSIKRTFIGSNSTIQSKSRLLNCIIMNGVTIEENCKLTNCIVCDGVIVEKDVTLKDCIIGAGHTVSESYTKEILVCVGFMEF